MKGSFKSIVYHGYINHVCEIGTEREVCFLVYPMGVNLMVKLTYRFFFVIFSTSEMDTITAFFDIKESFNARHLIFLFSLFYFVSF